MHISTSLDDAGAPALTRIDIIIPVYRGESETRACIESVLTARNNVPAEIVVVNDASPEPGIRAYVTALAENTRIRLIDNETNLGFVASCNRAFALHPERNVVLLNSDTLVADGWLDRMAACAAAEPMIASVTPFSNNGTLCSYPRIAVSNTLPPGQTVGELDASFANVNIGHYEEIPTGVGFCMLIMRAAIDDVGTFDVEAFGRGYGEENDWCMRASLRGFSHKLCGDVFVYHRGEVSFGDSAQAGKLQAQWVIDLRYPGYRELISRHLELDPARKLRRRMDLARLASSLRPRVLFVTHNCGGIAEKYIRDLALLVSDSLEVLVFKPHDEHCLSLSWLRNGEEFTSYFEDRKDPRDLLRMLRAIGISRMHLHHVHGLPSYILDLHIELGVPLDITLHDYFPVTQRYRLGPGGAFESSTADSANDWGLTDVEWHQRMGLLLRSAQRVIAPSHDLARRMSECFPEIEFKVRGHPDLFDGSAVVPHKVLVLGNLSIERGLNLLESCAIDARERKLPLFYTLLGHTAEPIAKFPELPLAICGTYRDENLEQLIALERADAFLFLAQSPEAYSYALNSALRTKLPIIASAIGAFNEQLNGVARARTVSWDAPPSIWNDALLEKIGDRRQSQSEKIADGESKYLAREYCSWYLAPIGESIPTLSGDINFRPHIWYAPKKSGMSKDERSLQKLFMAGVECGHAPSLEELRRRTGLADDQIFTARNEIAKASHRIESLHRQVDDLQSRNHAMQIQFDTTQSQFNATRAQLEAELGAERAKFDAVISSTSWRVTGLFRSAAAWVRAMRAILTKPTDR